MNIAIDGEDVGLIEMELYMDAVPLTVTNFMKICNSVGKDPEAPEKGKLSYKGSKFHRVLKEFGIQGGDITFGDGTGGWSIYGETFPDEKLNHKYKHDKPGVLTMVNQGFNMNNSQFFITTAEAQHLDGIHVVFGHVVNGMEIVKRVEALEVDVEDRPLSSVTVISCGDS
jgi:cyclophilin family peptidyl-prolyl cis-trans isomerase